MKIYYSSSIRAGEGLRPQFWGIPQDRLVKLNVPTSKLPDFTPNSVEDFYMFNAETVRDLRLNGCLKICTAPRRLSVGASKFCLWKHLRRPSE